MSSHLNDINLAFLDASDTIIEIVTYDSTTIHNTVAIADTFRSIGYPASKVRYLVNRADSPGGIDPADLERALGRVPEHRVVSDGRLVVQSNNEGVPFVLANPDAPISQGRHARWPATSSTLGPVAGRRRAVARGRDVRSAPDRGLRLRRRRADGPARDPPPHAGRVDDLPRRQRARALRRPIGRGGPGLLDAVARCPRGARRQGHRRRLQHLDRGRHRRPPAALRPADPGRHPAGRLGRRAGDAQPAGRRHRDAGHDPIARLLRGDQGREPRGRGLRARDPDARPAGRGRRALRDRPRRPRSPRRWRPCSANATRPANPIFPRPPGATIDTLLLGCTHYPLLRPIIEALVGDHVAIVDSATATASALAELLDINGLEAGDGGAEPRDPSSQLTTGDPGVVPCPRRPPVRRGLPRRRAGRAGGRDAMAR